MEIEDLDSGIPGPIPNAMLEEGVRRNAEDRHRGRGLSATAFWDMIDTSDQYTKLRGRLPFHLAMRKKDHRTPRNQLSSPRLPLQIGGPRISSRGLVEHFADYRQCLRMNSESKLNKCFKMFLHRVEPDLTMDPNEEFLRSCGGLFARHTSALKSLLEKEEERHLRQLAVWASVRGRFEKLVNPNNIRWPGAIMITERTTRYLNSQLELSNNDTEHPLWSLADDKNNGIFWSRWSELERSYPYLSNQIHTYEPVDGSLRLVKGDFDRKVQMILEVLWDLSGRSEEVLKAGLTDESDEARELRGLIQ
jgi:hypothetical protein